MALGDRSIIFARGRGLNTGKGVARGSDTDGRGGVFGQFRCLQAVDRPRQTVVLRSSGGRQPIPGAVLDTFLKLRLFDDPLQVVGIACGDLVIALAAVLAEMKAGV
jgi:hypothetical protein